MNYQKIYLLSFIGFGLVLGVPSLPPLFTEPSLSSVLRALGGVMVVTSGGYELFRSDEPNAPIEPNRWFLLVVLGFVLSVAGVVLTAIA